jgi:hypothetical protein
MIYNEIFCELRYGGEGMVDWVCLKNIDFIIEKHNLLNNIIKLIIKRKEKNILLKRQKCNNWW